MSYRKQGSRQYQPRPRGRLSNVIRLPTAKSRDAFRVKKWKVESHSKPGKYYTVSLRKDGVYECSCPQWIFRRKECKHIREVKEWLKQQETPRKAAEANFFIDEHGSKQYTF